MLSAPPAGGMLTATTTLAQAQINETVLEPRGLGRGGSNPTPKIPGPIQQNPDIISSPGHRSGHAAKLALDHPHVRLECSGSTRQVTVREIDISKNIERVNCQ